MGRRDKKHRYVWWYYTIRERVPSLDDSIDDIFRHQPDHPSHVTDMEERADA